MAHAASAAGAAASASSSAASSESIAADADGHKWVPAKDDLPGVYILDRGDAGAHAASKPRPGESMIRGLAPLVPGGTFPLHAMARDGDLAALKLALRPKEGEAASDAAASDRLAAADEDGRTILHWACAGGHESMVSWLLSQPGVSTATSDASGWSPLHSAASAGHATIVSRLLAAGADVNARTSQGRTPLHYGKGRTAVVEALLAASPDVNAADTTGATALMRFAGAGAAEACRLLVEAGASVDAADESGWTALHHAAEGGALGPARVLILDGKADFKAVTAKDETAGDLICADKLEALADIVRERIAADA